MDGFYQDSSSIFVEAYDALNHSDMPQVSGDLHFYLELARDSAAPVLEAACGTGRLTLPLAEAGIEIAGVDCSEAMLSVARAKTALLSEQARSRLTLIHQDMTELNLDRHFGLVFVPFRSFQHLLTSDMQKKALRGFHGHLVRGGRLVLHLFDPRLDMLIDEKASIRKCAGLDERTGRRYVGEQEQSRYDYLAQIRHDLWRYAELDADDSVIREDRREMALRWTYRWELHHLLALTGFTIEAEYSDFMRSPPTYGKELIVVAATE